MPWRRGREPASIRRLAHSSLTRRTGNLNHSLTPGILGSATTRVCVSDDHLSWGAPGVGAYRQSAMSMALGLAAAAGSLLAAGSAAAEWRVDTTIAPPPAMQRRAPAKRPKVEPPAEESPEAALPERLPAENPEEEREGEETREAAVPV